MTQKVTFFIADLDCPSEAGLLRQAFENQPGVEGISFDFLNHEMILDLDLEKIEVLEVIRLVRGTGMRAKIAKEKTEEQLSWWSRFGKMLMTLFCGLSLLGGFVNHVIDDDGVRGWLSGSDGSVVPWSAISWYSAAILFGCYFILPKAWAALRMLRPDMHLLMVVAVVGAILIGEWAEAATVTFLFSLALLLEHWSLGRAKRAVSALMDLSPEVAQVVVENDVVSTAVEDVAVGSRIIVKPGEKIPLDGIVVQGTSAVNQASITGESMPVDKGEGDEVFAGTLNEAGSLEARVTKAASETTLSRMIELVRQASLKRARAEGWVEQFAKIYTPLMMFFAASFMLLPPLVYGDAWDVWIYRGLVILVIACPCALVISTPVSIVAGLTAAARRGVLVKGGIFLEQMGHLKALAFDKTGTLTMGVSQVQEVVPFNGNSEDDLLKLAAALESVSTHPLAVAILEKASERSIEIKRPDELNVIAGKGAEGIVGGERYWIGSHRFLHEKNLATPQIHAKAVELEDVGHSVVVVGTDTKVCGLISIADEPRAGIADTIRALKAAGVRQTVMLTGDNLPTASALAQHAGIDRYFAELLPEDKVRMVKQLATRWGQIGMVGDGVNDAPAMASASVSIAMGAIGSDSAIETSDIALMADDLDTLPWLMRHSRRTLLTIKKNIGFALSIKALFFVLAISGVASLWMAIAVDAGASLLVIAYGLRLLRS